MPTNPVTVLHEHLSRAGLGRLASAADLERWKALAQNREQWIAEVVRPVRDAYRTHLVEAEQLRKQKEKGRHLKTSLEHCLFDLHCLPEWLNQVEWHGTEVLPAMKRTRKQSVETVPAALQWDLYRSLLLQRENHALPLATVAGRRSGTCDAATSSTEVPALAAPSQHADVDTNWHDEAGTEGANDCSTPAAKRNRRPAEDEEESGPLRTTLDSWREGKGGAPVGAAGGPCDSTRGRVGRGGSVLGEPGGSSRTARKRPALELEGSEDGGSGAPCSCRDIQSGLPALVWQDPADPRTSGPAAGSMCAGFDAMQEG